MNRTIQLAETNNGILFLCVWKPMIFLLLLLLLLLLLPPPPPPPLADWQVTCAMVVVD